MTASNGEMHQYVWYPSLLAEEAVPQDPGACRGHRTRVRHGYEPSGTPYHTTHPAVFPDHPRVILKVAFFFLREHKPHTNVRQVREDELQFLVIKRFRQAHGVGVVRRTLNGSRNRERTTIQHAIRLERDVLVMLLTVEQAVRSAAVHWDPVRKAEQSLKSGSVTQNLRFTSARLPIFSLASRTTFT